MNCTLYHNYNYCYFSLICFVLVIYESVCLYYNL